MQLIIDIGNTRIKAALFEENELKHFFVFDSMDQLLMSQLLSEHSIHNCIISSVVNNIEAFIDKLKQKFSVIVFTNETGIPIKNAYNNSQTLGSDRLAVAIGGNFIYPNKNVLIIDAGTCIKYNFVNNQNEYIGGGISPGLQMRFKALNTFTNRLPLFELEETFNTLIGTNSKDSILSGVEIGATAEIEGFIERYTLIYPDINIILTGGDASFFEKRLKKSIFVDPFLVLKGLNVILNYNSKA